MILKIVFVIWSSYKHHCIVQTTVYVQVVFMKLGEIDTIKETFSADVYIQARWCEPRLDGSETARKKVRVVGTI